MALLDWNASLSVGVAEMDQEHKQWVALINALNEAMKAGRTQDEIVNLFDGMNHYIGTHFASEERFMEKIGYSRLDEHKLEHAAMVGRFAVLKHDYDAGKSMVAIRTMGFLSDWVRDHIQGSDREYGVWVQEHAKR